MFASDSNWQRIIWNNKEIRIDKKPVYFKNYYESGVVHVSDLLFHLSSNDSSGYFAIKISKVNILQWAGLRQSIPDFLKVRKKKSIDYYPLLVKEKAQPPNINHKWKSDFNLSDDHLREFFLLPHSVALESYVKAFRYKVLNNVLYPNKKLFKIGD